MSSKLDKSKYSGKELVHDLKSGTSKSTGQSTTKSNYNIAGTGEVKQTKDIISGKNSTGGRGEIKSIEMGSEFYRTNHVIMRRFKGKIKKL